MRALRNDKHHTISEITFSLPGENGEVLQLTIDIAPVPPSTMRVVDELVRRWDHFEQGRDHGR